MSIDRCPSVQFSGIRRSTRYLDIPVDVNKHQRSYTGCSPTSVDTAKLQHLVCCYRGEQPANHIHPRDYHKLQGREVDMVRIMALQGIGARFVSCKHLALVYFNHRCTALPTSFPCTRSQLLNLSSLLEFLWLPFLNSSIEFFLQHHQRSHRRQQQHQ